MERTLNTSPLLASLERSQPHSLVTRKICGYSIETQWGPSSIPEPFPLKEVVLVRDFSLLLYSTLSVTYYLNDYIKKTIKGES